MPEKSPVPPAAPYSRFSEQEIEQGLIALAMESGNTRRAAKSLATLGVKVDQKTLYRWREKHSEKYAHLQRDILPKLRMRAAERHSAVADAEMEVGLELLTLLRSKKGKLDPRDLSTAIRNLDVGQGIHVTKAAELRGDMPPPQVHVNLSDTIRSMAAKGTKFSDAQGNPLQLEEAIEASVTGLPPGGTKGSERPSDSESA